MGVIPIFAIIQFVIVIVFAVSSSSKIFGYSGFRNVLIEFKLSRLHSDLLAVAIILFELAASLFIVIKPLYYFGLLLVLGLSVVFSAASALAMYRNTNVLCSCFGDWMPDRLGKATLIKAGVIAFLVLYLIFVSETNPLYGLEFNEMLFAFLPACGVFLLYILGNMRNQYVAMKRNVLNLPKR